GRADLALAPDEPTGFAMTLLRLLAFEPATSRQMAAANHSEPLHSEPVALIKATPSQPAGAASARPVPARPSVQSASTSEPAPGSTVPSSTRGADTTTPNVAPASTATAIPDIPDWPTFVAGMKLSGIA